METFKIKAVIAAVEMGSLSRAAEKYAYTPSAFSHMLSSFENELGIKIFDRSLQGVTLTEEGKCLYPHFLAMIDRENSLSDAVQKLKSHQKYHLKIGTYSSISRNFLSVLLKDFSNKNPDIRLYISVVDSLTGWLEDGHADVIFADGDVLGKSNWIPILEDRCVAVSPRGFFTDKQKTTVTREELYAYPHILTNTDCIKNYFDERRFENPIHLTSEDDLSIIKMVKEGLGLTVLPELVLREISNDIETYTLEPPVTRTIGFAYKRHSKQSSPELNRFIRYVKSHKHLFTQSMN